MGRYETPWDEAGDLPEWLVLLILVACGVGLLRGFAGLIRDRGVCGLLEVAVPTVGLILGAMALLNGSLWLGLLCGVGGVLAAAALSGAWERRRERQRKEAGPHALGTSARGRRTDYT